MRKKFLFFAGLCVLLSLLCIFLLMNPNRKYALFVKKNGAATVPVSGVPLELPETEAVRTAESGSGEAPEAESASGSGSTDPAAGTETGKKAETKPTDYVSPIDFGILKEKNPDIYAWLSIPGTDISYPVVQNADDAFYLDHDENREPNAEGTIFSESAYNGTALKDAITVLYGHHMKSGRMFGNLQQMYSDPDQFDICRDIVLYTPEKELRYRVFAAVPYDNRHILYTYGNGEKGTAGFLYSLSSVKSLDANLDTEEFASSGDKLLVLSTCLKGERTRRYIVAAKLVQPG